MVSTMDIIKSLNADIEVVVIGEPSNETEYQRDVKYISGADANGTAIYKDTQDYTWSQIQAQLPTVEYDQAIANLRQKRNNLLAKTDWTANSDVTMSSGMTTYRQALRDATNGLDTVAKVNAYTFPTEVTS